MSDYHWLIIGGGLHGRFIAASIATASPAKRLAVIDPAEPLATWHRRTAACGMVYLRSSSSHHLGQRADSLRRFASEAGYDERHSLGRYRRPSLDLFNHHATAELGTPEHYFATASRLEKQGSGWRVHLDDGRCLTTEHVVLATGPGIPYRPPGLTAAEHLFDDNFALGPPGAATVIIGGGISGGQLALRATDAGHRVCWLTRHSPEDANFDSDPCYAGPRCLTPFLATSPVERTQLLAEARLPGTLPPDIYSAVTNRLAAGELTWRRGAPARLTETGLTLTDGRPIASKRVILATGFVNHPAPDSLLGRTIADFGLAGDPAGHLYLDDKLTAASGLHIVGRPASMQLGPMAGNIKGARMAGRILASVARREAMPARAAVAS